jgi:hypothetical protein
MLYVRVELWRRGDPKDRALMGEAFIRNVSTGARFSRHSPRGDYAAKIIGKANRPVGPAGGVSVSDFPRKALTSWDLLFRVLKRAFGARNDDTERRLLLELRAAVQALQVAGLPTRPEAHQLLARSDPPPKRR